MSSIRKILNISAPPVFHILLKENRFIIVYFVCAGDNSIKVVSSISSLVQKNIEHLLDRIWNEAIDSRIHDSFVKNPRRMDVAWPLFRDSSHHYGCHHFWERRERERENTKEKSIVSSRKRRILVPLENFNWHFYNLCTALSLVFFCIAELTRARQCLLMKQSIYRS